MLVFMVSMNFFSPVSYAKTKAEKEEEKKANKEFDLQKKREKELAKVARRTNILKVQAWANAGDVQAQVILSYAHYTGQRIDRNTKLSREWKEKATANNAALVENFIPIDYGTKKIKLPRLYGLAACRSQIGQYVEQNFYDAMRWAELGASENDELSFAILGSAYYTGRGTRQDYKKAIEYLKKAGNEPVALSLLSDAYAKGNGVDRDLARSQFYADYLESVVRPKIDKQREKNLKKIEQRDKDSVPPTITKDPFNDEDQDTYEDDTEENAEDVDDAKDEEKKV